MLSKKLGHRKCSVSAGNNNFIITSRIVAILPSYLRETPKNPILTLRPQIRWDYPLNLSISISGGKETNKDSPSNGECRGKSPNLDSGSFRVRVVILRTVFSAGPCISLLKSSIIEGDNPVYDMDYQCIMIQSLRVELFGNAAQSGW